MGIPACSRCRLTGSLYDPSVVGVGALPPGCPTGVALEINFEAYLCLGGEALQATCSNSSAVSYLRRRPRILLNGFTPGQEVGVCLVTECETCDLQSLAAKVADVLIREAVKPTDPRLARHLPEVSSYHVKASWQRPVLDCSAEVQHRWAELQRFHGILESDFKSCRAAGDRYFWTTWSYITDAAPTPTGLLNFECQLIESPLGHGPLIYRGLMCKDVEGRFDDVFVTGYCLPTSCNGPPLEHFFGPVRQLSVLEFTPDLQPWWARLYESQSADLTQPRLVAGTCLAAGAGFRLLRWLLHRISARLSPSTSSDGETDRNPVIPRRLLVPDLLRIVAVAATLQCHTDFSNKWLKTFMSWLQFGIFFAISEFLAARRQEAASALVHCSRLWRKGSRELPHLALTVWAWSGAFLAGDWTGHLFQRVPGFTSAFYLGAQNCMRSLHQRGFLAELFHLPIYFVGAEAAHWKPCGSWLVRMDFQLEVALTSLQLVQSLLGLAPRLFAEVFMTAATMAHMVHMTVIETEALGLVRGSFTFAWIMRRSLSLHARMFRLSSPIHALGLATAFLAVAIATCTKFVSLPHVVRKAYPHLPEDQLKTQLLIEEAKIGLLGTLALPHAALLLLHSSEFIEARCTFLKPVLGPLCGFLGPLCFGVLLNHGFLAFASWEFIGKLPENTLELPAVLQAPGRARVTLFVIYVLACYVVAWVTERLLASPITDCLNLMWELLVRLLTGSAAMVFQITKRLEITRGILYYSTKLLLHIRVWQGEVWCKCRFVGLRSIGALCMRGRLGTGGYDSSLHVFASIGQAFCCCGLCSLIWASPRHNLSLGRQTAVTRWLEQSLQNWQLQ